ncbi:MAG: DUF2752 domain-containing protein [Phycisphaerae bacterium]|nr:DUF2752 domain-containing protein [Phycisphaerae bacterium]NUQ44453.1 DUF2752 domain-containing protein [Phycisphaerae bacterium]
MNRHPDTLAEAHPVVRPWLSASRGRSTRTRWIGAIIAAASCTVLGFATYLPPSESGVGTHRGLGLPPCGFLLMSGLPCPTCGMTSAFSWMMHGHPVRAFISQPVGALLSLAVMAAAVIGTWMVLGGRRLEVDWYRVSPSAMVMTLAVTFFVGWGVKIALGLATGVLPYRGG